MPLLMKLPGVTGEGTIAEHIGWLPLTGFAWGGTRGVVRRVQAGNRVTAQIMAPQLRTATVRRKSDSQSALIWKLLVTREADVPKINLDWLRTGTDAPVCYFSIEFTGVRFGRITEASTGEHPIESIEFNYRTVTLGVRDVGNSLMGAQDIVTYAVPQNI